MKISRVYYYNEPDGEFSNVVIRMTYQDVLNEYWDFWLDKMIQKYGEGHKLITEENCVQDWCVTHWAWMEESEAEDLTEVGHIMIDEDEE
jgi:hypothetical protein